MINKLLKSSITKFILIKYLGFVLQFINSVFIAKYLGLFYFGIYGFVNLCLHYLSYMNLGVNYSLNVLASTDKVISRKKTEQLLFNSILISLIVGLFLLVFLTIINYLGLLSAYNKYLISEYYIIIILITTLKYFNTIYINVYRIYNKLSLINLNYLLPALLQVLCLLFFKDSDLFWSLLIALLVAQVILFFLLLGYSPVSLIFKYNGSTMKHLIRKGFFLLTFNVSFYLIMMSSRSIVSYFYTVEDFGLYNFANSVSIAIMLFISSISFLIFPKMLNKLSNLNNKDCIKFIETARRSYLSVTFLLVFSSLAVLPLLLSIIPDYKQSLNSLVILAVSQLIIANSFGYSTLLIQKNKEKELTIYGFIAVGIVVMSGITTSYFLNLNFDFVALSVVLSVLIYNFLIIRKGNQITGQFISTYHLIKHVYNYKYFIPLSLFAILHLFSNSYSLNISLVIISYLILNFKDLSLSIKHGISLVLNDKSLEMKIDD